MWIGVPGRFSNEGGLREIRDGAASFDRSPDLGVTEFRSLAGGITTWTPSNAPRRYKLTWTAMMPEDVRHIDLLARQSYSFEPLAVIDPLSSNMLGSRQAEGRGSTAQWGVVPGEITFMATETEPFRQVADVRIVPASGAAELSWVNPNWSIFPVPASQRITWWPETASSPTYSSKVEGVYLHWYTRAKTLISSAVQTDTARPLVATSPANAAFMRPAVRLKATGLFPTGYAALSLGDTSAALLAGSRPIGEGSPAYSITGYRTSATPGDGSYRDIGLDLVEVTNSATG
ncbi:hypothetical protein [Streptomyces sp. NPDC093111]|uniref:hypothetical protein n=1 Tax=Streptomyces sp. NPDC093111 TaxID=3154978 RepID=UPI00342F9D2C